MFGHLNINSIRSKLELLSEQVKGNLDVFMISETKVNDSFPIGNFIIDSFSTPHSSDRDSNGGGIVREDIPSTLGGLYVEFNLRNENWLIYCSHNSHKNTASIHSLRNMPRHSAIAEDFAEGNLYLL